MSKIENSGSKGRFTEAEARAEVAKYKRRMAVPGAAEREARAIAEARATARSKGTKFPALAKRAGNVPSLALEPASVANARLRIDLAAKR